MALLSKDVEGAGELHGEDLAVVDRDEAAAVPETADSSADLSATGWTTLL
jgi:hypothetical protein